MVYFLSFDIIMTRISSRVEVNKSQEIAQKMDATAVFRAKNRSVKFSNKLSNNYPTLAYS